MPADVLVDTDVFVDHLRGARPFAPRGDRVRYSAITRCELLSGARVDEGQVQALLAPFVELVVDRAVAERAGRLRRDTGIATPDALIAASALLARLTLVTRKPRHFDQVRGLRVREPA